MWGWGICAALALSLSSALIIFVRATLLQRLQEIILLNIIVIACYTISSFLMPVKCSVAWHNLSAKLQQK